MISFMQNYICLEDDGPCDPDSDSDEFGPRLLRETAKTTCGKTLFSYVIGVHFSTIAMCELFDITPKELTSRALNFCLIRESQDGFQAGPIHYGQGFYDDDPDRPGAIIRPGNIADAYWSPDCFEPLGLLRN